MDLSISDILNILQSISIIIASCVAIYGINSWRREIIWKRKYELAEETLSLFYEVKDCFDIIRNPFSHEGEGNTRKSNPDESLDDKKLYDSAYVVFERYERRKEPFIKLFTIKYRFISVFGSEKANSFDEIKKIIDSLFSAANILARNYWKNQGKIEMNDEQFKTHSDNMKKYEAIFWSDIENPDVVREKIDSIINDMESICQSILKR